MLRRFIRLNQDLSNRLIRRWPSVFGSSPYEAELRSRIWKSISDGNVGVVIEVGGIDRPLLSKRTEFKYVGVDIDERPDCLVVYDQFIRQSIEDRLDITAQLIVSITLLEHVPDNRAAFDTMFHALSPGGVMHHYVPSKWHPYAVLLRVLGTNLQRKLIALLRPSALEVSGYQAFFDKCSIPEMKRALRDAGFSDLQFQAYYRANDYFSFFVPAFIAVSLFENLARVCRVETLASGFVFSATKPAAHR
ncbi:methyltransferase domain-containing protein [Mesorhizobium sp. M1399]|uniref:methyltransferase domain-containing protein n=1 Tax=Mesorhizobium sp. M1399 TaxID=2957096 RepID=UPI0033366EE4